MVFHFPKSKLSCHSYRSAPVGYVIFDVVIVRFERRQSTLVDQAVISAAIDIAGGVFAAAAGNNLADQHEIFILHDAPTSRDLTFSQRSFPPLPSPTLFLALYSRSVAKR